ncbi:MAG: HEAT repeat domain-containing protein [Planctomycetia bacterium]|nr:HEAT repeat domain-containing protein [Planctomycetia bacterium]
MNDSRLRRAPRVWSLRTVLVALVLGLLSLGPQVVRAADDPEKTVETLIAELGSPDTAIRKKAALDLAKRGPKARAAVAQLATGLEDPEPVVRNASLVALGEIGEESASAVEAIVKLCETDVRLENRHRAVQTLAKIGPQAKSSVKLLLSIARGGQGERGDAPYRPTDKIRPLIESIPLRCDTIRTLARIAPDEKDVRTLLVLMLRAGVDEVELHGTRYFVTIAQSVGECGIDAPEIVAALERGKRLKGDGSGQQKIREAADTALRRLKQKAEQP